MSSLGIEDYPIQRPDVRAAIWETVDAISCAESQEAACGAIAGLTKLLGGDLLSVKIVEMGGNTNAVRPWSEYPDAIRALSRELQNVGGCIFHRESMARLRPFLLSQVCRKKYRSLLERRFLDELDKLGYCDILAVPVVLGRGVAQVLIGLDSDLNVRARQSAADMIGHMIAALLMRFPEIGRLFDQRRLSLLEAHVLGMKAKGCESGEIVSSTGLSEETQNHLIESARVKLGARNRFELVRLATLFGEFEGRGVQFAEETDHSGVVQPEDCH